MVNRSVFSELTPSGALARCLTLAVVLLSALSGCSAVLPSEQLRRAVDIPVPESFASVASELRLSSEFRGEELTLTPLSLIAAAFDNQPEIKSSYERFKSEEARYDFFYASRDALTPTVSTGHVFDEARDETSTSRDREHGVQFSVEKLFFDTTRADVSVGYQFDDGDSKNADQPYMSADLRYPLSASREKLTRASEDIFRRNELDDAQLEYIQLVREGLKEALQKYYKVIEENQKLQNSQGRLDEMLVLQERLALVADRDITSDMERLKAEIDKVAASTSDGRGSTEVELMELKAEVGIPFHVKVEITEEQFNPFAGSTHEQLLIASLESDPELATLRNSKRNAEVQLDLAERGRWDIILTLGARGDLEGSGDLRGKSDWSVGGAFEVSAVDSRVTTSLISQARAQIDRFEQAIVARQNAVYVGTYEPLIRIKSLTDSRDALIAAVKLLRRDYDKGVEEYFAGELEFNIMLSRRGDIWWSNRQAIEQGGMIGSKIAELCAATGKFFEYIDGHLEGEDDGR